MEGRDVRFTVYVEERGKCLHCGEACRIEQGCIYVGLLFSYLKQSQAKLLFIVQLSSYCNIYFIWAICSKNTRDECFSVYKNEQPPPPQKY